MIMEEAVDAGDRWGKAGGGAESACRDGGRRL